MPCSLSSPITASATARSSSYSLAPPPLRSLRFCGLTRQPFAFNCSTSSSLHSALPIPKRCRSFITMSSANGAPSGGFDYDLVIIGAGVGGHGAALHAVEKVLSPLFVNCFILCIVLITRCSATSYCHCGCSLI